MELSAAAGTRVLGRALCARIWFSAAAAPRIVSYTATNPSRSAGREHHPAKARRHPRPIGAALQSRRRPIARRHSINPEQQNRSDHREQNAPQREAVEPRAGNHVAEEAAEERADDSDENRDDHAAGITAGHDRLRDRASDKAENHPRKNRHIRKTSNSGSDRKSTRLNSSHTVISY